MIRRKDFAEQFRRRFADREELAPAVVVTLFHEELGVEVSTTMELLNFLENEFLVPQGLLRASDNLEQILTPVKGRGFLWKLVGPTRADDAHGELVEEIAKRVEAIGLQPNTVWLQTVGDLARVWSGAPRMR
jgi:hypothetical protein